MRTNASVFVGDAHLLFLLAHWWWTAFFGVCVLFAQYRHWIDVPFQTKDDQSSSNFRLTSYSHVEITNFGEDPQCMPVTVSHQQLIDFKLPSSILSIINLLRTFAHQTLKLRSKLCCLKMTFLATFELGDGPRVLVILGVFSVAISGPMTRHLAHANSSGATAIALGLLFFSDVLDGLVLCLET